MSTAMTFARRRRACRSSIEQLEGRALLSVVVGQFAPTVTKVADAVQVVGLDLINTDTETAQPIAVDKLPDAVTSAVKTQVPEATIVSAEGDVVSGALQFGVRAEIRGVEFTITLAQDGRVLEIEQPIATSSLPQAVQDWLQVRFPDASILQAELLSNGISTSNQLQLTIAIPSQPTVEAIVLVANGDSSVTPIVLLDSVVQVNRDVELRGLQKKSADKQTNSFDAPEGIEPQMTTDSLRASFAARKEMQFASNSPSSEARHSTDFNAVVVHRGKKELTPTALGTDVTLASTSIVPASVFAGVLADALPVDMETIEFAMREFLDGVGSLANEAVGNGAAQRWIPPLLSTIAGLFCLGRLVRGRTKAEHHFVIAIGGRSSWSWVMKLSSVVHSGEQ